ncbi:MAG TPA: hypothetical protein VFV53_00570 [Candidatus Limnocylindrales bacterium]|nr:hypothetical protein [Candidatus Limnocylindrales bacterium]
MAADAEPEADAEPVETFESPESEAVAGALEAVAGAPEAVASEPEAIGEPVAAPEPILAASWPEIEERTVAAAPASPDRIDEELAADGIASGGIVPGSYLPPSTVHRPGTAPSAGGYEAPRYAAAPGEPATWAPPAPPASSGGWIPPTPGVAGAAAGGAAPLSPSGMAAAASSTPARSRDARPPMPGRASILADLPFDAPDELEGWLVALGGGMGVLGFFLPWTGAIGEGLEGYLGSWGLGVASRLPVFFLVLVVAALAVLPNRVATWVRTGVCGMVSGGILLGLVWLYLGSDASQLGALLAAVGAVLLIAGGIIAVAPGRSAHRREDA